MTKILFLFWRYGPRFILQINSFIGMMQSPLGSWQAKCWDPAVGSTRFEEFCDTLSKPFGKITTAALELPYGHDDRKVTVDNGLAVDFAVVNYGKWIKNVRIVFFQAANLTRCM